MKTLFLSLLFVLSCSTLSLLFHLSTVTASTTFDGHSLIPSPQLVCPVLNFMEGSNLLLPGHVALLLMVPNQTLNQWFCPEPHTFYSNLIKVFQSQLACVNFPQASTGGDTSGGSPSESSTGGSGSSETGSSGSGGLDDDDDDDGDESFLLWLLPHCLKDWWKAVCHRFPHVCEILKVLGAGWWLLGMLNEQYDILTTLGNIYSACLENPWYLLLLIPVAVYRRWNMDVATAKKGKGKKKEGKKNKSKE